MKCFNCNNKAQTYLNVGNCIFMFCNLCYKLYKDEFLKIKYNEKYTCKNRKIN